MGLLIKRNNDLFPKMSTFFDDFATRDLADLNFHANGSNMPAVNIYENDNGFRIELAAPGFDKADFNIELNNQLLSISAEEKKEKTEKDTEGRFTRREFSYQSFKRSFTLPENTVDGDKIEAAYENGILKLHVPKLEEKRPKPARVIDVK